MLRASLYAVYQAQRRTGDGELDNSLIKLFATLMETLILDDLEPRLGDRTFQQLLRNLIHLATAFGAFPVEEEVSAHAGLC